MLAACGSDDGDSPDDQEVPAVTNEAPDEDSDEDSEAPAETGTSETTG
jgi:hypothetical protein